MVRRWQLISQLIQQVADEEEDEGVVVVVEEGGGGQVVAVVVGEDVGAVKNVVRLIPLTLWRRNS